MLEARNTGDVDAEREGRNGDFGREGRRPGRLGRKSIIGERRESVDGVTIAGRHPSEFSSN